MEKKIFYNQTNYGEEEINAVVEILKTQSFSLVSGSKTLEFEKKISEIFGKKFGLFVNSGSSASIGLVGLNVLRVGLVFLGAGL